MDNQNRLEYYYMAYFDILGYRKLLCDFTDEESAEFVEILRYLVDEAKNLINSINKSIPDNEEYKTPIISTDTGSSFSGFDIHIKMFSDNFFVYSKANLFVVLQIVAYLQARFVTHGIFVRGAVHYGRALIENDFIYGKGLIEVVELEEKLAKSPRIVVSENFMLRLERYILAFPLKKYENAVYVSSYGHFLEQGHKIIECDSSVRYIDYLSAWNYFVAKKIVDEEKCSTSALLEDHKKYISLNLEKYENCERVLHKYKWVRDYHDNFCRKHDFVSLIVS